MILLTIDNCFYMKYLFIIIVSFINLTVFGQDLGLLKLRLDLLETTIDFKLDSTGLSKLSLPSHDCVANKLKNNWHVQDLNNDGLDDLIYSGTCTPYYQTSIYLNNQKGFELVCDYPGKIISIDDALNTVKINMLKSSCCCDNNTDFIEISIYNTSEIKRDMISFDYKTKIKTFNKLNSKIVSGILRKTPTVDNKLEKDPCTDATFIGNQIKTLNNISVVILNKKDNWSLVLVKLNKSYSVIGWIKNP